MDSKLRISVLLVLPLSLPLFAQERAKPAVKLDRKVVQAITRIAEQWFEARPKTCFEEWNLEARRKLLEEAGKIDPLPEGALGPCIEILWKAARKTGSKRLTEFESPDGTALWLQDGKGGPREGLVIGLHGGGEGAGDASEAQSAWKVPGHLCLYPQGIRLVHDTWNTVHGERFILSLIEWAKLNFEIDPDRVYVVGFSMGGTGSWFMAGRHPDLLAGAIPAHGVFMASPKSQLGTKEEVTDLQHGLLPNARNLAVYFYTGGQDRNCMPGTFLYAWERILQLKEKDPEGYRNITFTFREGLAHSFPEGEPDQGIEFVTGFRRDPFPKKIVWQYASEPFPLPTAMDQCKRLMKRQFYWLHCRDPKDAMNVTATYAANEFDLQMDRADAKDFTIYLQPAMIDAKEDVTVRVDGKEIFKGRPVPRFDVILESFDAHLDQRLVFDRKIELGGRP